MNQRPIQTIFDLAEYFGLRVEYRDDLPDNNAGYLDPADEPQYSGTTPACHWFIPSPTHHSGYYRQSGSTDTDLFYPTNTYEILAYAVESRSFALGATASVNGFTPLNLIDQTVDSPVWPPDPHGSGNYKEYNAGPVSRLRMLLK